MCTESSKTEVPGTRNPSFTVCVCVCVCVCVHAHKYTYRKSVHVCVVAFAFLKITSEDHARHITC